MTWTDLDRLTMLGAAPSVYLNGVKNNVDHLQALLEYGHYQGKHIKAIDAGASVYGAMPQLAMWATFDGVDAYSEFSLPTAATATRTAAGVIQISFSGSAFDSVDDYAGFAVPITSPNEGDPLVSYSAHVYNSTASECYVYIHSWDDLPADTAALADCSFFLVMFGSNANTTGSWSTYVYLPDLVEGCPVPTEWYAALFDNLYLVRSRFSIGHNLFDGTHKLSDVRSLSDGLIPQAGGVLTYKASIQSEDRREWVVEPWSHNAKPEWLREISRTYVDTNDDTREAKLAALAVGPGYSTPLKYGTLCTPNPYQVAANRARYLHPMQFNDSTLFAPRYWDGSGLSFAEVDEDETGAPDSFAFLRFGQPTTSESFVGSDRLLGLGASGHEGDDWLAGLLLNTLIKEEVDELYRLMLSHHDSSGGHAVKPPGIIGVGRVNYDDDSASDYAIEPWSTGLTSVTKQTGTPVGCRLTFSSAFSSYRNLGVIVCGDLNIASGSITNADYCVPQVERNDSGGAYADVHLFIDSTGTPTAAHGDFNYLIIGAR